MFRPERLDGVICQTDQPGFSRLHLRGQFSQVERTQLLIESLCQNVVPLKDTLALEKMIDRRLERGLFRSR